MNEVLDKNFKTLYPRLETDIRNATFIAIDAEFTGIYSREDVKYSLFDTLADRYKMLKKNIQQFIIAQFGITVFRHNISENTYTAQCFNFYLFPKSFPYKNRQFSCQVSALEFLRKYGFEFDKLVNEGISYLDEIDEKSLRYLVQNDVIFNLEYLSHEEDIIFKDCISKISEWLSSKSEQTTLKLQVDSPILQYIVHKYIRNKYNNLWTLSDHMSINVMKKSNITCEQMESNLEEELLNSYIGFSKVFKLLSSSKKTIIGHNILLDLMFIHQQFYKPLPDSYDKFKSNMHILFPHIYDTKFLSGELRNLFHKKEVNWKISSLSTLYEYFTSKGQTLSYNSPKIKINKELPHNKYHNAGWDAYIAGYIFIKMAHLFCIQKFGIGTEERGVTHSELINSIKGFENSVHITKGNEMYMKLDGADPISSRPEWLHITSKSTSIDIKQLMNQFSSFGVVDIMPLAQGRVLVAVGTHRRLV
ncbi:Poly(A)-specific ribonuclease PARN-like domain-containing protein 1 [Eufriesea mexicana]|uniref:Poly(A)-specific ribonuclease PARN-like domain-containing protein 1 n=1 Tax=Eufriesea mexicana TaxID=516756 RepID=A0A310SUW4_9HYME|nr:Poly(A)-specific ribonuclease PARN-like domain-containing protein 1 [Eufriesea mexicana]